MSMFVLKGSSIRMSNFSINLETGEFTNPTFSMGYDVFPQWLAIAVDAARSADRVARKLDNVWDGSGDPHIISLLEQEIRFAMQCVVAVAAAIDGFYGSALARAPNQKGPEKGKRRRGRHRVILSYFQQKFVLDSKMKASLEEPLSTLFKFRDAALHSHGEPEELAFHPRHKVAMPRKVVMFRAENAVESASMALKLITYLSICPKPKFTDLSKHCQNARAWTVPIAADWLTDHTFSEANTDWLTFGPTRSMFERKGLLPHWLAQKLKRQ